MFNILIFKRVQSKQTIKIEESFKISERELMFFKDNFAVVVIIVYLYSETLYTFSIDVIIVVQNDHHYNYHIYLYRNDIISGYSRHI